MTRLIILLGLLLKSQILFATDFYVDGSVPVSGNGLSWETAWKTIAEAHNFNLQPGDRVWIKNGTYVSGFYPSRSGAEIISLKTGVEIKKNRIFFPAGTDLSGVDIVNHPGEFYVYVYRSWKSNNGVFVITEVNVAERFVRVSGVSLLNETGVSGDAKFLSATIGRPIVFRNGADDPQNERVILDVSSTSISTIAYMQNKNYLMVDGIDLTGSKNYGGWHIVSSNNNVIINSRIWDMGTVSQSGAPGILIEGNTSTGAANYNIIMNNEIFNTPYEGVYIGKGGGTANQNHTNYNHIIGNKIYTLGSSDNAKLENAIDIKEFNIGNVAERNKIGPFQLASPWNGAIDIVHHASNTLIYNNTFTNVVKGSGSSYYYIIGINNDAAYNYVFNNVIYNDNMGSGFLYGISLKSTNLINSYVAQNTIYNLPYGFLLDNSSGNSTLIANNIIHCNTSITNWSNNNLTLMHNLYLNNPGSYASEPGRLIGNANFKDPANHDFRLSGASTLAIDNGVMLNPSVAIDLSLIPRDNNPDRGAFELPSDLELPELLINIGDEICEGASGSIIVSQGLTIHGGSLTLIAVEKILFLPGTVVHSGGELHAYISNQLCNDPLEPAFSLYSESVDENPEIFIFHGSSGLNLYPNPVNDLLTLCTSVHEGILDFEIFIYSAGGMLLLQKNFTSGSKVNIDVSNLHPGAYLIRIQHGQVSLARRFIKI